MKNTDPHLLSNLPTYSDDGAVNAVVAAPKGSLVKLRYDAKLGAFTVSHDLSLGLSYPFDWVLSRVPRPRTAIHWMF
jgi:inorganic pyrophosphatase